MPEQKRIRYRIVTVALAAPSWEEEQRRGQNWWDR